MKFINKRSVFFKTIALGLALISLCFCATSCAGTQKDTIKASTVVGTVDGEKIYYDELYFLVNNYLETVSQKSGGDPMQMRLELDKLIKDNITTNTAILRVCESAGLRYDQKDQKKIIDAEIESIISQDFSGDKELYKESLAKYGLTERYVRYTTGLDLLYEDLLMEYPKQGKVSSDTAEIKQYIKSNFVRTKHIMNTDKQKIEEILNKINSGETTFEQALGSKYNSDFSDISGNGFYFSKGSMEQAYESTAFALEIDEMSGIVVAKGEDSLGNYGDCYYIIKRFEIDNDYIDQNLTSLQVEYYSSVIFNDMNNIKGSLEFVPNDFYSSLDLTSLPALDDSSVPLIMIISIFVGVIVLISVAAIIVKVIKKKKSKKEE